jgi:hypothetical protein
VVIPALTRIEVVHRDTVAFRGRRTASVIFDQGLLPFRL